MKKFLFGVALVAVAVATLAGGFGVGRALLMTPETQRGSQAGASANTGDQAQIENIVRNYLIEHPEVLVEAQQSLAAKQAEQQQVAQAAVLDNEKAAIWESSSDGIIGNPNGSETIVEFFDYNCGYCKHALSDMQAMVEINPDLRFIMKEFPILGPDSQAAHLVSAALKKVAPEKYPEFHVRMLSASGRAGEAQAIKAATDLGVDETALRAAMKDPSIIEDFNKTYELASKLQITGTPSYVVGNEVVFGAMGAEVLTQKVEAARGIN